MQRTLGLVVVLVIVISSSLTATVAAKTPIAEMLLEQAVRRYHAGQLEESVALLKRAAPLAKQQPALQIKIQLQLGFANCVLGRVAEAEAAFRQALQLDPSIKLNATEIKSSIMEVFDRVRTTLSGELEVSADRPGARVRVDGADRGPAPFKGKVPIGERELVVATPDGLYRHTERITVHAGRTYSVGARLELLGGRLEVTSEPTGARVLVDGKEVGKTPLLGAVLPPAQHRVELLLAGYADQARWVELRAHQTARVSVKLERLPGASVAAPVNAGPRKRRLRWTWVAAGTAVAVGVAGLGLGLWAKSGWDAYKEDARSGELGGYLEKRASIPDRALAANICFGLAGAAAATAVVLFFFVETPQPINNKPTKAEKVAAGLIRGWEF